MTKRVDLSVKINLPKNHSADRVSVDPDGRIRVYDKAGNEITPKFVERSTQYQRPKGPKYQARAIIDNDYASVGGLGELARLDSLIVIDTNSTEIQKTKVSAAFFIACKIVAEDGIFRLASLDDRGHVYELHDVSGNAEMLAILKVAHDTLNGREIPKDKVVGFFTDSELQAHHDISNRKVPIYGDQYLPKGFTLHYASSDTGQELVNRLIKFCDRESRKYLDRLNDGAFRKTGLASLEEDTTVRFRYTYYPSLEIVDPIVHETKITSETKYSIQYHGDDDK